MYHRVYTFKVYSAINLEYSQICETITSFSVSFFVCFLNPLKRKLLDFPGGEVGGNPPANAGDTDSVSDPGRFHMP